MKIQNAKNEKEPLNAKRNLRKRMQNIYLYHKPCGKRMRFLTAILIALDLHVLLALHTNEVDGSKCGNYLFDLNTAFMNSSERISSHLSV